MTTRFYGKAETAAKAILNAFQQPDKLPAALAPMFIHRHDDVPCRSWSWSNQLLVAIYGHADARGFRQWLDVGRHVKRGEHGFPILVPLARKLEETGEDGQATERVALYGFKHAIVFGLSQTDGEPLPGPDPEVTEWLGSLPLLDVAREWGLSIEAFNGRTAGALGKYTRTGIALGVQNLSTWAHELMHAADDRLGNLKELGQHWRSETVAELGGATLLTIIGEPVAADLGGCWEYVRAYAKDAGVEPVAACQRVLKRLCDAVALVLDTAETIREHEAIAA